MIQGYDRFQKIARRGALLVLSLLAVSASTRAAEWDVSDAPLFVVEGADPNVVLTMDDSGSMQRAYMPESLEDYVDLETNWERECTSYRHGRCRRWDWVEVSQYEVEPEALSSHVNRVYYNPDVEYVPPVSEW